MASIGAPHGELAQIQDGTGKLEAVGQQCQQPQCQPTHEHQILQYFTKKLYMLLNFKILRSLLFKRWSVSVQQRADTQRSVYDIVQSI